MQRVKDMMPERSTRCSKPTREVSTPRNSSTSSCSEYGDFFPDSPQNLDELVHSIARSRGCAPAAS